MIEANKKQSFYILGVLICIGIAIFGLIIQGCQKYSPQEPPESIITPETSTSKPSSSPTFLLTATGDASVSESLEYTAVVSFAPPSIDPATPIPDPLSGLNLSDEILIWVLLGSDTEPPFIGRTPAIHLLFIHPRFSKASLVSIPGDLFVYIPGYTMQRISTAYAMGGIELLLQTFAYNFGVTPSRFVLAHPGDFQWLVDDINTIEVSVLYPMPQTCGGIRAGLVTMDGTLALCYASYREGMDEVDRMQRQQQVLSLIFRKLTQDGNLVMLPILYASYEGWVETNFSLEELMGYIPLALRLADPDRISYYMLGSDQTRLWDIPGTSPAQVFLPKQTEVKSLLQQAIDDLMEPMPLTNQVKTLEAQLTAAFHATITAATTNTPTPEDITPTWIPTLTPPSYP
jgi:LCP family protein required for cell wall assembly